MEDINKKIEILNNISFKLGNISTNTKEIQVLLSREDCIILQSLISDRKKELKNKGMEN